MDLRSILNTNPAPRDASDSQSWGGSAAPAHPAGSAADSTSAHDHLFNSQTVSQGGTYSSSSPGRVGSVGTTQDSHPPAPMRQASLISVTDHLGHLTAEASDPSQPPGHRPITPAERNLASDAATPESFRPHRTYSIRESPRPRSSTASNYEPYQPGTHDNSHYSASPSMSKKQNQHIMSGSPPVSHLHPHGTSRPSTPPQYRDRSSPVKSGRRDMNDSPSRKRMHYNSSPSASPMGKKRVRTDHEAHAPEPVHEARHQPREQRMMDKAAAREPSEMPRWAIRVDWSALGQGPHPQFASTNSRTAAPAMNRDPDRAAALLGGTPFPHTIPGVRFPGGIHRRISAFLSDAIVEAPPFPNLDFKFEVEAKFGTLEVHHDRARRLDLPITTEAIVPLESGMSFRSLISEERHVQVNELLNSFPSDRQPAYTRSLTVDSFYPLPPEALQYLPNIAQFQKNGTRMRVTRSQSTGQVLEKIIKIRVGDLHIFFPGLPNDVRLSVNMEVECTGPLESVAQAVLAKSQATGHERKKNRLSYDYGDIRADLTVITLPSTGQFHHELEIEADTDELYRQGTLLLENQPNRYEEFIEGLVQNICFIAQTF